MNSNTSESFTTPVSFFIFNRPQLAVQVFEVIRQLKPSSLLVVADGPRPNTKGEEELCRDSRYIIDGVNWPCRVLKNYSDTNQGCKRRMSTGLDWVFNTVDRAIVLEDDCLPDPSFFPYCAELLERFSDDKRIMQICGTNVDPVPFPRYSYTFSKYGPVWGWASWRRAWREYDVDMEAWPQVLEEKMFESLWNLPGEAEFRIPLYESVYRGEVDTWDIQWGFAKFLNSGLNVIPSHNLISNIGFGPDATHTKDTAHPASNRPTQTLGFPLRHYPFLVRNQETERRFHFKMTPPQYLPSNWKEILAEDPDSGLQTTT